MADNKIQLPQSGGGILRYSDEVESKLMIGPTTVVIMILIVIALAGLLHALG